jgi:hypothetical protein
VRIAFFVTEVASAPGFEDVVSAHVQVPLHVLRLLAAAGHDVELITNRWEGDRVRPRCLPDVPVHQVTDGRRRGGLTMHVGPTRGVRPARLAAQFAELRELIARRDYDVVHVWGANRMAYLGATLRALGFEGALFLGMEQARLPDPYWPALRPLWNAYTGIVTGTHYLGDRLRAAGLPVTVLRHGVVRRLPPVDAAAAHRVLFWRDPSWENGADVCLDVFRALAPRHPEVAFDLAVRPHWAPVAGIEALAASHPNVHVHAFPYPPGLTLERLLAESVCVLLPFRQLSTHPQLAVLESMGAARAVVTSEIGSNPELVISGHNGVLVAPGDVEGNVRAVEHLLSDRPHAAALGARAAASVAHGWGWDGYADRLLSLYRWPTQRLAA